MNDQQITRLEAQLEKLVEGVFAHLFGKRIRAHDIALQIARAMEDNLESAHDRDTRPLAPDRYLIRVNADVQSQILHRYPGLTKVLSEQIVELAANVGYRLNNAPVVLFIADPGLADGQLLVKADHINQKHSTTQVMQPIRMASAHDPPDNAQLIIKGEKAFELQQAIVNIGRSRDNHIVINDPHSSRYHAQIRLRFGYYTIFDANSQSGTFVNDVRIKEHRLQPGDVIRIGITSLLYMEDDRLSDSQTGPLNSI